MKKVNAIKKLRTESKLTQAVIAERLHIDVSTVTKWETGDSKPRIDKLPELARIFNCKIDDLFS